MGKGADRGNKRVYTFTLDKERDDLIIKWLETQSTTKAVIEGLKLVMAGGNSVLQANQMNQLVTLLTANLMNNTNAPVELPQQSPVLPSQPKVEEKVEEKKYDEETEKYAEEKLERLANIDPLSII